MPLADDAAQAIAARTALFGIDLNDPEALDRPVFGSPQFPERWRDYRNLTRAIKELFTKRSALIVGDVVLVVSCFGIARAGIRCDAKGVALQGLTLSHRFTWDEIVRFENREFHGIGVIRGPDGWNQLASPKMFGKLSDQTVEQLDQQRQLHQRS